MQIETCRRCNHPALYVVWGKFFDKEDLGPRCAAHLPTQVRTLEVSQWAIYKIPTP